MSYESSSRYRTGSASLFAAAIVFMAFVGGTPAWAQVTEAKPCVPEVLATPQDVSKGEAASVLIVKCGDRGVMLGSAERHEISLNPEANALAVTRWNNGVATIQLVFVNADGQFHIDDLSREIARKIGRSEARDLSDVAVGLEGFAKDGAIEIVPTLPAAGTATRGTGEGAGAAAAPPRAIFNVATYRDLARRDLSASAVAASTLKAGR